MDQRISYLIDAAGLGPPVSWPMTLAWASGWLILMFVATPVADFGKQAITAITAALGGKAVAPKTVEAQGLILNQANYAATSGQVWGCASS